MKSHHLAALLLATAILTTTAQPHNMTDMETVTIALDTSPLEADTPEPVPAPRMASLPSTAGQSGEEGELRLVNRVDVNGFASGALQVFFEGAWGAVCSTNFDDRDALVACRQLGFRSGTGQLHSPSREVTIPNQVELAPFVLENLGCLGNESLLVDCVVEPRPGIGRVRQGDDYDPGVCDPYRDTFARVVCAPSDAAGCNITGGTTEGSVRLQRGRGSPCGAVYTGFIEILHAGEWGGICPANSSEDQEEDNLLAEVVCRQLGFPHADGIRIDTSTASTPPLDYEATLTDNDYYFNAEANAEEEVDEPVERFWLSSVACSGTESALTQCDLGEGFLGNNASCPQSMRGSTTRLRVECRQFPDDYDEAVLLEAVQTPGAEEGDLRLIDQGEIDNWTIGRLQVFLNGSWSQVCSAVFNASDTDVACRQLGFGAGTVLPQALSSIIPEPEFRQTSPTQNADAVTVAECTGNEARLVDCDTYELVNEYESAFFADNDVIVDCFNFRGDGMVGCVSTPLKGQSAGAEGDVRFTNRTAGAVAGSAFGMLEIFHAGAWGTVCDGEFGVLETTADLACQEFGFLAGSFEPAPTSALESPPWLSGIRCSGAEASVKACPRSAFGDTASCPVAQRLFCFPNRQGTGEVRLTGGSADPGGAWAYGALEVLFNGVFNILDEGSRRRRFDGEVFGRRGAQVACRSLGFATGGQMLVGWGSPFPAPTSAPRLFDRVSCTGFEADLGSCTVTALDDDGDSIDTDSYDVDYADGLVTGTVALVCTSPSGCSDPATPPVEGDVRLVPLNGTAVATQACDDVHFGGVELFHDGRWGGICAGNRFLVDIPSEFTLDAQVVCRQLGFPYGTVMDTDDVDGAYEETYDAYEVFKSLVWASMVVCTGKEERLLDCIFPQDFGAVDLRPSDYGYLINQNGYFENSGLPEISCRRNDNIRLGVICRRFEIPESDFIR